MLWRRAPRAVYRVYGEDEYLDGNEVGLEQSTNPISGGEHAAEDRHTAAHPRRLGLRSGRLVGIGLFVGVAVCALGLVVVNALHRPSGTTRSGFVQHTHNVPAGYASTGSASSSVGAIASTEAKHKRTRPLRDGAQVKTHSSIGGSATTGHGPDTRASEVFTLTRPRPTGTRFAATRSVVSTSSAVLAEPDQSQPSMSLGSPPEAASLVAEREFGFEQ
ncbi:MAG: hypothetical protein WBQ21_07845 [Solirubrobacteraceae bacterium]